VVRSLLVTPPFNPALDPFPTRRPPPPHLGAECVHIPRLDALHQRRRRRQRGVIAAVARLQEDRVSETDEGLGAAGLFDVWVGLGLWVGVGLGLSGGFGVVGFGVVGLWGLGLWGGGGLRTDEGLVVAVESWEGGGSEQALTRFQPRPRLKRSRQPSAMTHSCRRSVMRSGWLAARMASTTKYSTHLTLPVARRFWG